MATADMYLQFPGGGNNRLNEPNRDVRNQNRLFDSQNNNRFGHNQHSHYFFTESEIDMQWTVQHSCGPDSNVNCDIILQYACEDNLRDGEVINTIPVNSENCKDNDCNSDYRFGMHEDYQSYQHCSLRERNKGLFTADRHLRGQDARFTRQENNGARYGYECNEERDYYPYWHPTIWKDIAIFTDDLSRCDYYQQESENVKGRWYCHVSDEFLDDNYDPHNRNNAIIPTNKDGCEALEGAEWKLSESHRYPNGKNMTAPVCKEAPYQRDNHHGNGDFRYFVGYKWTVPEHLVHSSCAVRIRYNMTSSDYDAWSIDREAKERNERLEYTPRVHEGKCYGLGEGPARIAGTWFSDLDIDFDKTLQIKQRTDNRIKLTRNDTESEVWRVRTGTHWGHQWVGWRSSFFRNKNVTVSFDVKFAIKPTTGHYGMKFMGKLVNGWVAEAPIGEWYHVELNEILPAWGDGDAVLLIFDGASVDFEMRHFQLRLNFAPDDDVVYGLGTGPAIISGLWFDRLDYDMDTVLYINERADDRLVLTRNDTESDIWNVQVNNRGGWQWFGWADMNLRNKKVKVSFDVKFITKPTTGHYGMKFMGKLVNDWVAEAPLGEWYHVELEEILPRWGGDGDNIIMIFDHDSVDYDLRGFQICVEDELALHGNPYSSMQDDLDWDPYQARERGYQHKNDARLQIFEKYPMRLRSAYNTDQLGRVFEDRSHKLEFVQLPEEIKRDMTLNNKKLYNINARGKIGNNVEVYPAFEYDFVPSRVVANKGDYIHIQWSGSNSNDHNNDHSQTDSQGRTVPVLRGKDRYNMVAIDDMNAIRPTRDLEKLSSLLGLSALDAMKLAFSGVKGGDNEYLQSAGAYFDLGPRKLTEPGKHMFMSTNNNAHGVRNQKGKIVVLDESDDKPVTTFGNMFGNF